MNYCSKCGSGVRLATVPGDSIPRYLCDNCQAIHYQNPRMVVGSLPRWENKILLCKRAIEPCKGLWTLPAGFLENGETVEQGAVRETLEEANAPIDIVRLFSVYSMPQFDQIYLLFLANLNNLDFHPGAETLEVKLFEASEIPWNQLAFSPVKFTLEKYLSNPEVSNGAVYLGAYGVNDH
ncbi:MAG: NUDIX hydrolase [bacterium]